MSIDGFYAVIYHDYYEQYSLNYLIAVGKNVISVMFSLEDNESELANGDLIKSFINSMHFKR